MIDIEKLYIFNVNYLMSLEISITPGNHLVTVRVCSVMSLCYPTDCSPPGSSVHGDSPGNRTGADCQAFLQGIFPTQGSNPRLWVSCTARWVLHHCAIWEYHHNLCYQHTYHSQTFPPAFFIITVHLKCTQWCTSITPQWINKHFVKRTQHKIYPRQNFKDMIHY